MRSTSAEGARERTYANGQPRAGDSQTHIVRADVRRTRLLVRELGPIAIFALGISAVLFLAHRFLGHRAGLLEFEPKALSTEPISASFGFGRGVRFEHPLVKEFEVRLEAPLPCALWIHFQSKDISEGQILVSANGYRAGYVPADGLRSAELSHELLIGAQLLRLGEVNRLAFVNEGAAHGKAVWRVWSLWAEAEPLPQMAPEQLSAEAEIAFRRGKLRFEQREIGAPNRFLAWKDFRNARLLMEAHPEPRPRLYDLAQQRMDDAQQELDALCAKLMLEIQRAVSQHKRAAAHALFERLNEYFPSSRSACVLWAERRRLELGL